MKFNTLTFLCITSLLLACTLHIAAAEAQQPKLTVDYPSRHAHLKRVRRHRRHLGYLNSKFRSIVNRRRQDPPSPESMAAQPSDAFGSDGGDGHIARLSGKDKMVRRKSSASTCNMKRAYEAASQEHAQQQSETQGQSKAKEQPKAETTSDENIHHTNSTGKIQADISLSSVSHSSSSGSTGQKGGSSCFPALGFKMPGSVPSSLNNWWCDPSTEQAFLGFSYQVEGCPSRSQLTSDFKRMHQEFHSRYVRLYGACDSGSFNDDLIESAWEAGVGIYPLIWFGFNSDNKWKSRKQKLMQAIKNNPKAPYVVRGVVMGSEPLFDGVLPVDQLVGEMDGIKQELKQFTDQKTHGGSAMHVTSSDMSYSYQEFDSKSKILQTATVLQANVLPFFSQSAKFGNSADAMKGIKDTYSYLRDHSGGHKKIIFAQTGWPSTAEVWKGNSKDAVASVASEEAYFKMLDKAACEDPTLSKGPQGGLGWFAHIWSDSGLPGWGVVDSNGKPKFDFKPRTSCH